MFDLLFTYLLTVLAAFVVQQGDNWMSMLDAPRILKAAAWPLIFFNPIWASLGKNQGEDR